MVKIVLDAGHGGSDPGAVYEGRQEKDDNLQLVFDVGAVLENHGIDVEYTRVTDVYQSPYEKAAMANQSGADYFVSIHRNARDIPNTEGGVETLLYSTEESVKKDMAEAINRNLEEIGFTNRGVIARPNLVVLRDTDMPALLVEAGFIDSEADNALFDANRAAIADAIAYGILAGLPGAAEYEATEEKGPGDGSDVEVRNANSGNDVEAGNGNNRNDVGAESRDSRNDAGAGNVDNRNDAGAGNGDSENSTETGNMDKGNGTEKHRIYRVQVGVYRNPSNARMMLNRLEIRGHQAYMLYRNGLYYIQVGAFPDLSSAVREERRLKSAGFSTLVVTES